MRVAYSLIIALVCASASAGQAELSEAQRAALSRCVSDLQSEAFSVRAAAAVQIQALGPAALSSVKALAQKAKDPEVRSQLESLAFKITREARMDDLNRQLTLDLDEVPARKVLETIIKRSPSLNDKAYNYPAIRELLDQTISFHVRNMRAVDAVVWLFRDAGGFNWEGIRNGQVEDEVISLKNLGCDAGEIAMLFKRLYLFTDGLTELEARGKETLFIRQTIECLDEIDHFVDALDRSRVKNVVECKRRGTLISAGIREKMEQTKLSIDADDESLADIIASLQKNFDYTIHVDSNRSAHRLSLYLHDVPLSDALEWLARLSELRVNVADGAVSVGDQTYSTSEVYAVIYNVDDLTLFDEGRPAAPPSAEDIANLITGGVSPWTWDVALSTSINECGGRLVVMQTSSVHAQIQGMLDGMRSMRKQRLALEPHGQPPEAPLAPEKVPGVVVETVKPPPAWKSELERALETKVTFDFVDVKLTQAIDFIRQKTGANMVLDPRVIEGDPPAITLRVTDTKAMDALRWIARLGELEFDYQHHAIILTKSANVCSYFIEFHTYYVNDLRSLMAPAEVAALIKDFALTPSFADPVTSISDSDGMLNVLQAPYVHAEIQKLLTGLRLHYKDAVYTPRKREGDLPYCAIYNVSDLSDDERRLIASAASVSEELNKDGMGGKLFGKYVMAFQTEAGHQALKAFLDTRRAQRAKDSK